MTRWPTFDAPRRRLINTAIAKRRSGLVSLWNEEVASDGYFKMPLTKEQQNMMEAAMAKGGATP